MFVYQSGVSCNQNYVFSAVLMSSGSCSWIVEEEDSAAARVRMLLFQVFLVGFSRSPVGLSGRRAAVLAPGQRVTESVSRMWCSDFPGSRRACLSLRSQRFLLEDVEVLLCTFRKVFLASLSMKPRNRCGPE